MNLTDYTKTSIYQAYELVRRSQRYGIPVVGAEVIGLVPLEALTDGPRITLVLKISP